MLIWERSQNLSLSQRLQCTALLAITVLVGPYICKHECLSYVLGLQTSACLLLLIPLVEAADPTAPVHTVFSYRSIQVLK